ncbi:MAG: hypothetical protein LQ339_008814 [Xanthoria mediterranea]|nr:MAG: hypothetical protein LQ339_008814 [Xanthoria mediterranea]
MSHAPESREPVYLEHNSPAKEYEPKSVLLIYDKWTDLEYEMCVEEADMYTWVLTSEEVGGVPFNNACHFDNACRCWAMKRRSDASAWTLATVEEGVRSFTRVMLGDEMGDKLFKDYLDGYNARKSSLRRALAKAECKRMIKAWYFAKVPCVPDVQRLPQHIFDTITMGDWWHWISKNDIAITLTYLYRTAPEWMDCSDFALSTDMRGEDVQYLQEYYESFFPGDRHFKWWKNKHLADTPQALERLKQLPWLKDYLRNKKVHDGKSDPCFDGSRGSCFHGVRDSFEAFKDLIAKAKEWRAAQRAAAQRAAQTAAARSGYRY